MTERPAAGEHPDDEAVHRHADGAAPRPGEEALFAALDHTRADLAAAPRPAPPEGLAAALQAALAAADPARNDDAAPGPAPSGPTRPDAGQPSSTDRVAPARPADRPGSGPADRRDPRRPARNRRRLLVGGLAALAALAVLVGIGVGTGRGGGAPAPTAAPGPDAVVVSAADLPRAFRSGLGARDPSPLSDPVTRAGCLVAHGLPAGTIPLGTRAVVVDGRPGTLLVLATGQAGRFRLLVVGPACAEGRPDTVAEATVGG